MNRSSKKLFLDLLTSLGEGWVEEGAMPKSIEALKEAFLEYGSPTPSNLETAELIDYGKVIEKSTERPVQGWKLKNTDVLVSHLVHELGNSPPPPNIRETYPWLTDEAWGSMMQLVYMVLHSFEYDVLDDPALLNAWKDEIEGRRSQQ